MINKEMLYECKNREEARNYLSTFKASDLKQFANQENIYIRGNKTQVIDIIIERTIGLILAMNAIKKLDLSVKTRY